MTDFIESMDRVDKDHRSGLDRVMVLGLGGCGCNTVAHLANYGLKGPKLIAANSDLQALDRCPAPHKIALGPKSTGGTGCGGDPQKGAKAAEESMEHIFEALKGAEIVYLTAGMGGGTGTGAAPVVAKALSELPQPPLLVAVILLPFSRERKRMKMGKQVLVQLSRYCKSVIPVYNDMLAKCFPKVRTIECMGLADDILLRAVVSVTDLIQYPGHVNVDMNDVRSILSYPGQAIMGCGEAAGEDRVNEALKMAVNSPLMADVSVAGAKGVLVNITSDDDILMWETDSINDAVSKVVGEDCDYIWGMAIDNTLKENGLMKITVIATGLELDESLKEFEPIVLSPEPEPEIIMSAEPAITLAPPPAPAPAPSLAPAASPEPELEPAAELKQVVRRRVIKLGGGSLGRNRLEGLKDDINDSPSFMRNRQD